MARKRRQARVKDKWTTKKWYTLIAPEYFGMAEIGETPADDASKVINRTVEITLADVQGSRRQRVHEVSQIRAYERLPEQPRKEKDE